MASYRQGEFKIVECGIDFYICGEDIFPKVYFLKTTEENLLYIKNSNICFKRDKRRDIRY